eukprot:m.340029 g.340029  ORF g.340029 m.340029 type:complete len:79 (-) comp19088_c0_seq1:1323-1559(-)
MNCSCFDRILPTSEISVSEFSKAGEYAVSVRKIFVDSCYYNTDLRKCSTNCIQSLFRTNEANNDDIFYLSVVVKQDAK